MHLACCLGVAMTEPHMTGRTLKVEHRATGGIPFLQVREVPAIGQNYPGELIVVDFIAHRHHMYQVPNRPLQDSRSDRVVESIMNERTSPAVMT
jgi:hypothetical protein